MKKLTNLAAIFCSVLLLFVAATGNNIIAESSNEWINPFPPVVPEQPAQYYQLNDLEKLIDFFGQEDPDGVKNGEKVDGYYSTSLTYPIGMNTVLWYTVGNEDNSAYYNTILLIQDWFLWGGWDLRYVDFYGDLDLSGTTIGEVSLTGGHISSVNLDNCETLTSLRINFSETCHSVSAVNASIQDGWVKLECGVSRMALGLDNFDSQVNVSALGKGYIGADFENTDSANTTLKSRSNGPQSLVGWFKDGEFITASSILHITEGGSYIAAFAGDVNDDGSLNVVDALQLMREAMGLVETRDVAMSDINCDGSVGINDAILLLRAVMGI